MSGQADSQRVRQIRGDLQELNRKLEEIERAMAAGADPQLSNFLADLQRNVEQLKPSVADAHFLANSAPRAV